MRALMLAMLLVGGSSESWAIYKTIKTLVSEGVVELNKTYLEINFDEFITLSTTGEDESTGLIYNVGNNSYWRIYNDVTITASAGCTLKKIKINYAGYGGSFYDSNNTTIISNTNYSVSENSVTFTFTPTPDPTRNHYADIIDITVVYEQVYAVPLNKYGYATFGSSENVLLNNSYNTSDFEAWELTGIDNDGTTILFTKITATNGLRGSTNRGVLLTGTPNGTFYLPVSSGSNGNVAKNTKLIAVTKNTTVEEGQYFGLVGNVFVPVAGGTVVPAGKALLPASVVGSVKTMNIVFSDETGIREVRTVSGEQAAEIFNLAGQRLQKTQKGVNIVNGKKVLVK